MVVNNEQKRRTTHSSLRQKRRSQSKQEIRGAVLEEELVLTQETSVVSSYRCRPSAHPAYDVIKSPAEKTPRERYLAVQVVRLDDNTNLTQNTCVFLQYSLDTRLHTQINENVPTSSHEISTNVP